MRKIHSITIKPFHKHTFTILVQIVVLRTDELKAFRRKHCLGIFTKRIKRWNFAT